MRLRIAAVVLALALAVAGVATLSTVLTSRGGGRVIHVSVKGSDAGSGTVTAPYATIAHALDQAQDGDTVRLASGTYREGELVVAARVRLEAGPRQKVVLSGATQVSDWRAQDQVWVSKDELVRFCQECTLNPDPGLDGAKGYPEQVYLDGVPLEQVDSQDQVVEGTFYVPPLEVELEGGGQGRSATVVGSRTAHYVLGSDPRGRKVEVVQHSRALTITGDGASVAGLTIEKYAPTQIWGLVDPVTGTMAAGTMVLVQGDHVRVDRSVLRQATSGSAIHFTGASDQSLTASQVRDNAGTGLEGDMTEGLVVSGSYFTNNNSAGFETSQACGRYCFVADARITRSSGARFELNRVDYADSAQDASLPESHSQERRPGVWLDKGVVGSAVVGNYFVNTPVAVRNETCSNTVIASNLVNGAGTGIHSLGSDHARIWNNTLAYALEPVVVQEDPRTQACQVRRQDGACVAVEPWAAERGLSWDQTDTEVFNNIITSKQTTPQAHDPWRFAWHIGVQAGENWDGTWVGGAQMVRGLDYNVYYHQDSTDQVPVVPVLWSTEDRQSLVPATLAELTDNAEVKAPERGQNGWEMVGPRGGNPLVVREASDPRDYAGSDFRLKAGSQAKGTGKAVFGDVAHALGIQERTVVDRGALFNAAWGTSTWQPEPVGQQVGLAAPTNQQVVPALGEGGANVPATALADVTAPSAAAEATASDSSQAVAVPAERQNGGGRAVPLQGLARALLGAAGAVFLVILGVMALLSALGVLFPARKAPLRARDGQERHRRHWWQTRQI